MAPSEPAALDVDQLYRFYRAGDEETLALRGVSLRCGRAEMVAVTGPSGSGKSTLLACMAGLDEPSGGTVWVAGERISNRSEANRSRMRGQRIGVLYQSGNLIEHLSVVDNVRLARSLRRGGAADSLVASRELLDALGIVSRAEAWPDQLSGGERARAGLAVALANEPRLLIADEPTGELDSVTERDVLDLLIRRARAGTAVVVASHSPAVAAIADQVVVLVDGVRTV